MPCPHPSPLLPWNYPGTLHQAIIFELVPAPSTEDDSFVHVSSGSTGGEGRNVLGDATITANGDAHSINSVGGPKRTNFDVLFEAAVRMTMTSVAAANKATATATGRGGARPDRRNDTGDPKATNEDRASIKHLLEVFEAGVPGPESMRALEWGWLSPQEAGCRAELFFWEAAHAQVRLGILRSVPCLTAGKAHGLKSIHCRCVSGGNGRIRQRVCANNSLASKTYNTFFLVGSGWPFQCIKGRHFHINNVPR